MDKMFKRFVDVGVFQMEIYTRANSGKTYLWLSMPSGQMGYEDVGAFYEVNSFEDVAKRLKEHAAEYLKDDDEEE